MTADLIADGGPREKPLRLDYVQSGTQAQRCGEIARRLGRLWRTGGLTLGPRFCELEEGDWIVWTSARRTGGVAVAFRIESYVSDEAWQVTPALREIASSAFTWSTADEIAEGAVAVQQTAPPPEIYGPPLSDISTAILNSYTVGLSGNITTASTSTDASITIPNHTRRYPAPQPEVSVTGATIGGLALSTFYLVYYDDPDLVGGAVTYHVTTTAADAYSSATNPARHFVGYVTTPDATGSGGATGGSGTPGSGGWSGGGGGGGGHNPIP